MIENADRPLPTLRRYLLLWFAGCAILMVLAYTQLLEYYLELGIDLRTQSLLERTATAYDERAALGNDTELPTGPSLAAYRNAADIPAPLRDAFRLEALQDGEIMRRFNADLDNDNDPEPVDTGGLCPERNCELLFLYRHRLANGDPLFLVHGVVGSDRTYDELELTERVAFGIGTVFTVLFLLGSFIAVRVIAAPLRRLNRWSSALSTDNAQQDIPALRFRELDTLAQQLRFAFERMREGVDKEKLFLRHASHELRTPLAILSANLELIDRLTDRPDRSEAEQASFVRQYRALEDIRQLTETLLWVNRKSENMPKSETIDLRGELDAAIDNHRHLLDAKPVQLSTVGESHAVSAPAAAVRIVLANLIRNAFQYAVDGEVHIAIDAGQVTIENVNSSAAEAPEAPEDGEVGFGLGLELVKLICTRLGWQCTAAETDRGWLTTVHF